MSLIGDLWSKIRAFRNANIERRERIARVKQAINTKENKLLPADDKALKIQKEYGVSYEDAFEYVKSERKAEERRASLRKIAGTLSEVGANAREQTRQKMAEVQFETPDITKSRIIP